MTVFDALPHPLAAFLNRGIGQANYVKLRQKPLAISASTITEYESILETPRLLTFANIISP
jgi:hypothetical protein